MNVATYTKIKNAIKNNSFSYLTYFYLASLFSKEKRENAIDLFNSPEIVRVKNFGGSNCGKAIYMIDPVRSYGSGFFSNFSELLNQLYFAEKYSLIPVVQCDENTHYLEKDRSFLNTSNYFEYFFIQPGNISVEEALVSSFVILGRKVAGHLLNELPLEEKESIYIRLLQKYIHFNKKTQIELDCAITKFLKEKRTLGVKYRGTDYFRGFRNHPIPATPEELAKKVKSVFNLGNYDQIYFATEDEVALEIFQRIFGDVLIFDKNISRYSRNTNHIDVTNQMDRCLHPSYNEGLNVLRDTWVLAHTQGLVASQSGVTTFANLFNRAFSPSSYEEIHVIDNGIYTRGPNSIRYSKYKYGS